MELPLSWVSTLGPEVTLKKIELNKYAVWIYEAELPVESGLDQIGQILKRSVYQKRRIILRGCNEGISQYLRTFGFSRFLTGCEALLNTSYPHFERRNLKELVKRGRRHGFIKEQDFTAATTTAKFEQLKKSSVHASEPQLKYLFRTETDITQRLFTFADRSDRWLGAVTISRNNPHKYHTELIVRHANAPVGVMEALIQYIFETMKTENITYLSLGEVPFITCGKKSAHNLVLFLIKKTTGFAYNSDGLYFFKNKFRPDWQPLYLCAKPAIKYSDIFKVVRSANFFGLLSYKLRSKISPV